ncbi:MAG: right-handed parallel beta-helix repeat-containing protein [Lentisphaeraceae bacterium]|nr:right-handed parallel beta-helix repeat-containing protein [Lentisphaeraceae bacterium]
MLKALFITLLLISAVHAETYFMAPDGSDQNSGTIEKPFSTITKAQSIVKPGDTVFLRGGIYKIDNSHINREHKIWKYVFEMSKSGEAGKPIIYSAYKNEKPVFDFQNLEPEGMRITAFYVTASWLHFKGLTVTGLKASKADHTQSECFENNGSNNIYELLTMRHNQAIGIYHLRGSNNLFLNCDAYENHDYTSGDKLGGNVDGFGAHPKKGSKNNIFRGCRAWFNSDDGYDCINSSESVTFENCWAFYNGMDVNFKSLADGNGFKIGGYGSTPVRKLPKVFPRHITKGCLAVRNKANGFYANHHIGGGDWINNRAYGNKTNFNMLCREKDNVTDIPGTGHKLIGNISWKGRRGELGQIADDGNILENNKFFLRNQVKKSDFISLDEKELTAPRKEDGSLPDTGFLKLKEQ